MDNQSDNIFSTPEYSIGAVVVSMDRTENLLKCVDSCLQNSRINEIVVLDYGSRTAIKGLPDNKKIKYYRLEATYWHLTRAYNIATQLSSCDIVIKLDADYSLDKNFCLNNYISNNEYISGFNQKDPLCGFLMIHKKDFLSINGYNERIVTYGYDDNDINYRLQNSGLVCKNLDRSSIKHMNHNKDENTWFRNSFNPSLPRSESIQRNRQISISQPWTNNDKMSKFHSGMSAIVCCMNRTTNLLKSLESWIQTNKFDEIIILDYGSTPPVEINNNSKIVKIYREPAKFWHLTRAYNIAAQLSTGEILVKLDCDYKLNPTFFDHHILQPNSFISGNHCPVQPLWGFLMVRRKDFFAVNGYNERMVGWGHDDIDINRRLIKYLNLKLCVINTKLILHLPHSFKKNSFIEKPVELAESRLKNIDIMMNLPWTTNDQMSKYGGQ